MQKRIFSFQDTPPEVSYLEPSFCLNVLIKDAKYHKECSEYSKKLEEQKTVLLFSNLGLDEIWFVVLRFYAIESLKNKRIDNPQNKWFWYLKENPKEIKNIAKKVKRYTTIILEIPNLILVEITEHQTLNALNFMEEYGLFPRDSIHASAAKLSGAETIITTDEDYARVEGLNIYTCNPKILELESIKTKQEI